MCMWSKNYSVSLLGRHLWILIFTDGSFLFSVLVPNIIWFRTPFHPWGLKIWSTHTLSQQKKHIFFLHVHYVWLLTELRLLPEVRESGDKPWKLTSYYSDTWTPMSALGNSLTNWWDSQAFSPVNLGLRKIASTFLSKDDFTWEYWLFFLFSRYQEHNSGL